MEEQKVKHWTNEGYFPTFEEADKVRNSLKNNDTSGFLQVKVKTCGGERRLYVVKSRVDESLVNKLNEVENDLKKVKERKKK